MAQMHGNLKERQFRAVASSTNSTRDNVSLGKVTTQQKAVSGSRKGEIVEGRYTGKNRSAELLGATAELENFSLLRERSI